MLFYSTITSALLLAYIIHFYFGAGPDGSCDPFAARAISSYKTSTFSFKKGSVVNILRQQVDANGICMYYGMTMSTVA